MMKQRKTRGILCAFGAVVFIAAVFEMEERDWSVLVTCIVIAIALAVVAVRSLFPQWHPLEKRKARAAEASKQPTPTPSHSPAPAPVPHAEPKNVPKYRHIEFHVAGTTFESKDGTPRQEYLRRIDEGLPPFDSEGDVPVYLQPYMYKPKNGQEEQAISVLANGHDIGNVPRDYVYEVMEALGKPGVKVSSFKVIGGQRGKSYGAIVVVRYDL